MSTPSSGTVADRLRRSRRSARRAWIVAVAAMLTGIAGGFLLPAGPVADLAMVVAMASAAGLSARGAYWHGQVQILEDLRPDAGQEPR